MPHAYKKIVLYQRTVPPYRKGFFKLLSEKLRKHKIRLIVASTDDWAKNAGTDQPEYIWLRRRFVAPIVGHDIRDTMVVPHGLLHLLRTEDPDLAVTEDLGGLPGNLAFTIHRSLGGCPYLVWSLGDSILGKRRSWFRPLAFPMIEVFRRGAEGFICYSEWAADNLSRKYRKPVYVAYNSTIKGDDIVDLTENRFAKYDGDGPLRLIFIGRLLPQKKVDVLLNAIAELPNGVTLDVIGDGPCKTSLESQAARLNISDRVQFHGAIHLDADKRELIDKAHLAVLPGLGGLFIQEAYARGLPVICGPADGTEQDLVRSINPEFYLQNINVQSLVERIHFFAQNREIMRNAAIAAIRIVRDKYNLESMADQWLTASLSQISKRP